MLTHSTYSSSHPPTHPPNPYIITYFFQREVPVLAVVLLGTNDAALPSRDQHVPVHEYEQHLRAIVSYLRDRRQGLDGTRATAVLLLTPPPVDEEKWGEHCIERGRPLDR